MTSAVENRHKWRRRLKAAVIGGPVTAGALALFLTLGANSSSATSVAIQNILDQEAAAAEEAAAGEAVMEADDAAAVDLESIARGLTLYRDRLKCSMCHAWNGKVARVEGEPLAADLTVTTLNYDQLIETIACGRLDSGMPNHLRRSYTDAEPCFGLTFNDFPAEMRPRNPIGQTDAQGVIDVTNYVQAVLQGKEMTFDNCVLYYEREAPQCERFRPAE